MSTLVYVENLLFKYYQNKIGEYLYWNKEDVSLGAFQDADIENISV